MILFILVLVVLSYREVVMVYTRAGGSYVVARENFGPRIAQVAAAALLIDYVVTVAVQAAAGTVAVVSAFPVLGPYSQGDHRGRRAAHLLRQPARDQGGRQAFALPTYLFAGMVVADDRGRRRPRGLGDLPPGRASITGDRATSAQGTERRGRSLR